VQICLGGICLRGMRRGLEQNVFDNTTLSFDDNKVLKMSTGYVNICSSVLDHRQKFKSNIGSGRTNESNGIYKKEAYVARKEHLKIIRS